MQDTPVEMFKGLEFDSSIAIDNDALKYSLIGLYGYRCSRPGTYQLRGTRGTISAIERPDDQSGLICYQNLNMYKGYSGAPLLIYKANRN